MGTTVSGDRKTILYVEDDLSVSAAVTDILSDAGYRVEHVTCGRTALSVLMKRQPDLLLLDLGLPDLDGIKVCRLARQHIPDLPIIALTARTGTAEVVVGLDAGADDYIRKPFDLDVLLARISAVLRVRDRGEDCGVSHAKG